MFQITELWNCRDEGKWRSALAGYWKYIEEKWPKNLALEKEMDSLDSTLVQQLDAQGWYEFLLDEYFRWKYTAPNRYATTTRQLRRYSETNALGELHRIKENLFAFSRDNIDEGLRIAWKIKGLGPPGASGLLAILFPTKFGVIDQFVVKALCQLEELEGIGRVRGMKPLNLTISDGVFLISLMRAKAVENNHTFGTDFWTPRRIDMVLWICGH